MPVPCFPCWVPQLLGKIQVLFRPSMPHPTLQPLPLTTLFCFQFNISAQDLCTC